MSDAPPSLPQYSAAPKTETQDRAEKCPACKRPKDLKFDKPAAGWKPAHGMKFRPMAVKKTAPRVRRRKPDPRRVTFY